MSTTAKNMKQQTYPPIRTSRDGRQYVKIGDVLNSSAGKAEIRRQAETETSDSTKTNGNGNQNSSKK